MFEDNAGVVAAKAADANVLPVYPEAMRKKGVEALVILRIGSRRAATSPTSS